MKDKILSYLFTLTILAITAYILASSSEVGILPALIKMTNLKYISGALLCMILYWLSETLIIKYMLSFFHSRQNFWKCLKISMIGEYYTQLTPLGSGGQPAQILIMSNDYKIPVGTGTSITVNKYMIYHVVVTVFPLVMILFQPWVIFRQSSFNIILIVVGIIINVMGTLFIFAICYNRKAVGKIVLAVFKVLHKFKVAKNVQPITLLKHIVEYKNSLNHFSKNKKALCIVTVLSMTQILALFSVTYFVYRSLGLSGATFAEILAVQSLLYLTVNFIPTPGNAGASEGFFYLIFAMIFPEKIILYAIMLYRLIIYYFNLVITGIFVLADYLAKRLNSGAHHENPAK